jgi:acyl-CoA synthetase (AMP-forming)/AMP-acid ligase II
VHSPPNRPDSLLTEAVASGRVLTREGPLGVAAIQHRTEQLRQEGLRPREAIGVSMDNGVPCILTYLALARLDVVAVPLPPAIPLEERKRLWDALGCRLALEDSRTVSLAMDGEPPRWDPDIFWVMHSSGSTGIPKAIPLTYSAVRQNAKDVMETLGTGTDYLHLGSMSHCYTNGLYNSFLLPLITGGRMVIGPILSVFKIAEYLDLARSTKPEILWVNPMVLSFLRRRTHPDDLASVKFLISCTAPLTRQECMDAETAFKRPVLQSYGLTETLIVSVEHPRRVTAEEFSAGLIVGGPSAVS